MVFAVLETPNMVGTDTKMYEWPSQLNIHDPINGNVSRHGVRVFSKYTYRGAPRGKMDDNEYVLTTIINMSYDRRLKSAWIPTPENPEVTIEPGEMHTYERRAPAGGDKNMRFIVLKRYKDELAADTNPFPYMQCSLIVHKEKNTNAESLVKWAVENGNILQVAGVFRGNLYKGSQSYTDRGDYAHFMIKPRGIIESSVLYPAFRDNRIFLQREAFYNVFNLPTILMKTIQPAGAHFAIPYYAEGEYCDKAYKSVDTQKMTFNSRDPKFGEQVQEMNEAQVQLKPTDPMYEFIADGPREYIRKLKARDLVPQFLYPVYFPPTRSFLALEGYQNEYDQSILQDLSTVSDYEIARMMGAAGLDDAYTKKTPEIFKKTSTRKRK
jgi:hypothetical protein